MILNKPKEELILEFGGGRGSTQFIRPLPHTKIENLYFAYIQNDLYKIEEFVAGSHSFGSFSIGNRGFKLFEDANVTRLNGISLANTDCRETDKLNLKVLVSLLKKSQIFKIDRLEVCWPVL